MCDLHRPLHMFLGLSGILGVLCCVVLPQWAAFSSWVVNSERVLNQSVSAG